MQPHAEAAQRGDEDRQGQEQRQPHAHDDQAREREHQVAQVGGASAQRQHATPLGLEHRDAFREAVVPGELGPARRERAQRQGPEAAGLTRDLRGAAGHDASLREQGHLDGPAPCGERILAAQRHGTHRRPGEQQVGGIGDREHQVADDGCFARAAGVGGAHAYAPHDGAQGADVALQGLHLEVLRRRGRDRGRQALPGRGVQAELVEQAAVLVEHGQHALRAGPRQGGLQPQRERQPFGPRTRARAQQGRAEPRLVRQRGQVQARVAQGLRAVPGKPVEQRGEVLAPSLGHVGPQQREQQRRRQDAQQQHAAGGGALRRRFPRARGECGDER